MTAPKTADPAGLLREQGVGEPGSVRAMVKTFAEALMSP